MRGESTHVRNGAGAIELTTESFGQAAAGDGQAMRRDVPCEVAVAQSQRLPQDLRDRRDKGRGG